MLVYQYAARLVVSDKGRIFYWTSLVPFEINYSLIPARELVDARGHLARCPESACPDRSLELLGISGPMQWLPPNEGWIVMWEEATNFLAVEMDLLPRLPAVGAAFVYKAGNFNA